MIIDKVTKLPTLGNRKPKVQVQKIKEERTSHSKNFAENLTSLADHINIMDFEHGKALVLEAAEFCLESNPTYLYRVRFNLENITTKLDLQKYVYNSILRGEKLYTK